MAFLLNKTSIASHFRSHSQNTVDALSHTRRAYHIELGAREKALLAEDPALKRFKSHKKSVNAVKRMGDVLTLVVVTLCYLLMVYAIAQNFKGLFGSLERGKVVERRVKRNNYPPSSCLDVFKMSKGE